MKPIRGFYCTLCSRFSGDCEDAELHVLSEEHNDKFKVKLLYLMSIPYTRYWSNYKDKHGCCITQHVQRDIDTFRGLEMVL